MPASAADGAEGAETAPHKRKAPPKNKVEAWMARGVQPKYFRGAERDGHAMWRKEQQESCCNKSKGTACRCADKDVLARLAGGGAAGPSEPVQSLKGGASARGTRRVAAASANAQKALGMLLCPENPMGALALGAKKLAKDAAPMRAAAAAAASSSSSSAAAAASSSTRSGAPATAATLRAAALQSAGSAMESKKQGLLAGLGASFAQLLGEKGTPAERRPMLAVATSTGMTHPEFKLATDITVNPTEWAEAGKRKRFPGPRSPCPRCGGSGSASRWRRSRC